MSARVEQSPPRIVREVLQADRNVLARNAVALMTLHVLGHLLEVPALALPDWRRGGPREAQLAGAGMRTMALGLAILGGGLLALLTYSAAHPWL